MSRTSQSHNLKRLFYTYNRSWSCDDAERIEKLRYRNRYQVALFVLLHVSKIFLLNNGYDAIIRLG